MDSVLRSAHWLAHVQVVFSLSFSYFDWGQLVHHHRRRINPLDSHAQASSDYQVSDLKYTVDAAAAEE